MLLIFLVSVSGCAMGRSVSTGPSTEMADFAAMQQQTVTVDRGDVVDTLQIGGQMKVRREVELVFDMPAGVETRVETLLVEVGQVVQAGQTLASIQPAPLERAVAEAELQWESAKAELEKLQELASEATLAQARVDVAKARLDLQKARETLEDMQQPDLDELHAKVEDAEQALALAQLDLKIAQMQDLVGKTIRDLEYTRAWQQRRYGELEQLILKHDANLEQMDRFEELAEEMVKTEEDLTLAYRGAEATIAASEATVRSAEEALTEAREDLAEAQGELDPVKVTKAENSIEAAEIALARAEEKEEELLAGVDSDELADAQTRVTKAFRELEEAQAALDNLELVAPFAGVVSQAPASMGDNVTAGTTVVVLSDLSTMRAVAQVDEIDIMRVREGMDVQLTFDAFPNEVMSGVVGAIPLETNSQDQYNAAVYYDVPVEFDYGELPLKPDMSVTLGFEIKRADNVLRLPTMALQSAPGGDFVEVVQPGGMNTQVQVETGVTDGLFTEIVAGLEEGDEVVVPLSGSMEFQGGRSMIVG